MQNLRVCQQHIFPSLSTALATQCKNRIKIRASLRMPRLFVYVINNKAPGPEGHRRTNWQITYTYIITAALEDVNSSVYLLYKIWGEFGVKCY